MTNKKYSIYWENLEEIIYAKNETEAIDKLIDQFCIHEINDNGEVID